MSHVCVYLIGTSAEPWAGHWDCWCCPNQAGRPRLLLPVRQRHDTTLSSWKTYKNQQGFGRVKKTNKEHPNCQQKQTTISPRSLLNNRAKWTRCPFPRRSWAEADGDDLLWAQNLHIQSHNRRWHCLPTSLWQQHLPTAVQPLFHITTRIDSLNAAKKREKQLVTCKM